jgi:predicted nucleotide-binding protein
VATKGKNGVQPEEPASSETSKRRRAARAKPYPPATLEAVLAIAEGVRDGSRTKEIGRIALAGVLDKSPASSGFRVLIGASADYGLTRGNYNSEMISLTDLGLAYVRPRDDSERSEALRQAALKPNLFARVYARLDQGKWPADGNLENILVRDFEVPPDFADEAARIARANALFAGMLTQTKGGWWLTLNAALRQQADEAATGGVDEEGLQEDSTAEAVESEEEPAADFGDRIPSEPTAASTAERQEAALRARVFVSHSKNPAILEQIKTILDFGQFVPVVAEEEETTAIPVPEKILVAMRSCGSGVISVSADEAERRDGGSYGINQNVLIEIGVAFALYDRRVVLVVDKRVDLPSNLQGLYRSEYEGDELGWTEGMKLQKALANFRQHKGHARGPPLRNRSPTRAQTT